jgi:hypothetical protein
VKIRVLHHCRDLEGITVDPLDGSTCSTTAWRNRQGDYRHRKPTRHHRARQCWPPLPSHHGRSQLSLSLSCVAWCKMNGTGVRGSSEAATGFDAPGNAPDHQISTNAWEQSGHTNSDGPCAGGGNASGGCVPLRITLWGALIFDNNFCMGWAKLCSRLRENYYYYYYVFRCWVLCSNGPQLICSGSESRGTVVVFVYSVSFLMISLWNSHCYDAL